MALYYGIVRPEQVREYAQAVCEVLGRGKSGKAVELLIETCAQETHCGQCKDRHFYKMGVGLYQFDPPGHDDVLARTSFGDRKAVEQAWGFDILTVKYEDLAFNPLFSTVFARLFYKLKPGDIPETVEARGEYWKRWYNTYKGAGTVAEYVQNARIFAV